MSFLFNIGDEAPERDGAWRLGEEGCSGPRTIPLAEFLAVFTPEMAGKLTLPLSPGKRLELEGVLAGRNWLASGASVWGRVQGLFSAPDFAHLGWAAFAAEGGRLAAEAELTRSIGQGATRSNPYSEADLPGGEDLLREIFAEDGRLGELLGEGYEPRDAQFEMAIAVWQCLTSGSDLLVEAPTGVGKSLAYCIPAGLFALMTGERVVISTHTRNLQDQLMARDLPSVCIADWFPVEPALLMGRENYVCNRRLDGLLAGLGDKARERLLAAALCIWRSRSSDGLLDELDGNPLLAPEHSAELRARNQSAEQSLCAARTDCNVTRARERARGAQLLIVNHSLLLSDYAVDGGILGEYGYLILDEAHHLDAVATRIMGVQASTRALDALIQEAGPGRQSFRWQAQSMGNWLPACKAAAEASTDPDLLARRAALLDGLFELREGFAGLMNEIAELPPVRQELSRSGRLRYRDEQKLAQAVAKEREALSRALLSLGAAAREMGDRLKGLSLPEKEAQQALAEAEQLEFLGRAMQDFQARLDFLLSGEDENFVFYLEGGDRLDEIVASPVDVSIELGDYFRERLRSAVCTSATLSVQGGFDYFLRKIGLGRSGREVHQLILPSPFDYETQATALLPAYLPDPGQAGHLEALVHLLSNLAETCPLNTLVLFTSYSALDAVRRGLLEGGLAPARLLHQRQRQSRDALAARFRGSEQPCLLLGTSSFWEGVDFPGETLKILIISRLPFAVPTEPLVEARCELIAREGGQPFPDYMIPEAVLRFKQGFGRLIRSTRDEGLILFLDSRLGHKSYGPRFLGSLPLRTRICFESESYQEELRDWYLARPRPKGI